MQAVLLAGGACSRFWPLGEGRHKSCLALMGKPIVAWTLQALQRAGVREAIVVQRPERDVDAALEAHSFDMDVRTVVQSEPRGMGDALLTAREHLHEPFLLAHAHQVDAAGWVAAMREAQRESPASVVLAGRPTDRPSQYGMLAFDGDRATGIVEKPAPDNAPSDIRALGLYRLPPDFLETLAETTDHEYAFEAALDRHLKTHEARVVTESTVGPSLKYPWDLFELNRRLMDRHLQARRADSAWISPAAHVEGDVHIGPNAKIFEFAVVKGPCYVGDGCVVGTHALVRDYTDLEPGTVIGAHAEAARCLFQAGASTHSGYFGDSIFDREARVGAGTVTANVTVHRGEVKTTVKGERVRTGRTSLGAVVGEETQLGINVSTMPGVLVGARSFVAPGITVEANVPSNARCHLRQETVTKTKRAR
ncbi:MAG: sugar phosphate nucleotidyltransferase [Candidatus Bipolaricaulia bacterium]